MSTNVTAMPRMLSARDLTQIIGSRALAYRLFRVADFPTVRLGKRVLVREDSFNEWWKAHERQFVFRKTPEPTQK
jgi:hypothetical protein